MKRVEKLLDFVSFTHEIRSVKRAMWVKDEEIYENDSEHGYQIAMVALYIIEEKNLDLDMYKCMAIALVHDVLEVYSGDTHTFGPREHIETKQERELLARKKLKERYPQLEFMHQLIDEYEERETKESKFIYALDKLVPILNNYLDDGRNWKKDDISFDDHVRNKTSKVALDPVVSGYFNDIMTILKDRPDLFKSTPPAGIIVT